MFEVVYYHLFYKHRAKEKTLQPGVVGSFAGFDIDSG